MEEDNAETVWGDNSRSIRVVWPDMRSVALLSLLCSSGEILKPDWEGFCLPGFSIRCYTRGLIGGSPRRRRQTETVKEEEPQLLFCADNQICMISGWTGFSSFLMLPMKGALYGIVSPFPFSPSLISASVHCCALSLCHLGSAYRFWTAKRAF